MDPNGIADAVVATLVFGAICVFIAGAAIASLIWWLV